MRLRAKKRGFGMDGKKGTDDKLQPGLGHAGQAGESHDSDSLSSHILGMNIPRTNKIYEMVTKDACGIKPDEPFSHSTPETISYLGLIASSKAEPGLEKAIACAQKNATAIVERLTEDQFAQVATTVIKHPGGSVNKEGCLVFKELRFHGQPAPGTGDGAPANAPESEPEPEQHQVPLTVPKYRDAQFSPGEQTPPSSQRKHPDNSAEFELIEFKVCPKD
jgi:hypothetical protein